MGNAQRILALAVFSTFGLAMAGGFFAGYPAEETAAPPALLPAAHAAPAEIAVQDTLHSGETISELLQRARLAESDAASLLSALREHQDPRRLRPGSVVSYRRSAESGEVKGIAIKLDADRNLSVERDGDAWRGTVSEVPLHTDTVVLAGSVSSSLYAALLDARSGGADVTRDERERIVDLLADRVFAWQVDFSRDLRDGDEYRILYERQARPDGTARSGRVLAVQFRINKRDYEAYLFRTPDGDEDYYQRDGGSLRRAFLRAPLEYRRISSVFASSRHHPLLRINRPHYGIDYAAASGTPVHAVGDAVVASAGQSNGYGNLIELRHKNGYTTRYGHLRSFARGIRRGVRVKQGDVIGYVGMTGLATGPHLHYEFRIDGRPVDPKGVKFISGDPVPSRSRAAFKRHVQAQLLVMDRASQPVLLADASVSTARNGDD